MELLEWAPPERLAAWVGEVTDTLLACVGDFGGDGDERWMGPHLDIVNPPIWEIAHVAWFAEWFVLRQLHGRDPLMAEVDARYDSGAIPHDTRWHLELPSVAETKRYVRAVGEALAEVTLNDRGLDSTAPLVAYAVIHYDAHIEALTYTRQTLGWGPAIDAAGPEPDGDQRWDASADLTVDGGLGMAQRCRRGCAGLLASWRRRLGAARLRCLAPDRSRSRPPDGARIVVGGGSVLCLGSAPAADRGRVGVCRYDGPAWGAPALVSVGLARPAG